MELCFRKLANDRVLLVKLKRKPFNRAIIMIDTLRSERNKEEIDMFYNTLENAKFPSKSQLLICFFTA